MDGELAALLRHHLPMVHWQRIETAGVGNGVPDLNYCYQWTEGWVELKKATGNVVGVRPTQVAWIERRLRAGGRVFIMIRRADSVWLRDGSTARALCSAELTLKNLAPDGSGGPAKWPWTKILNTLISGPVIKSRS